MQNSTLLGEVRGGGAVSFFAFIFLIPTVSGKTEVGGEEGGLKKGIQNLWRWGGWVAMVPFFFKVSVNK